jgi:hypothetical protein
MYGLVQPRSRRGDRNENVVLGRKIAGRISQAQADFIGLPLASRRDGASIPGS